MQMNLGAGDMPTHRAHSALSTGANADALEPGFRFQSQMNWQHAFCNKPTRLCSAATSATLTPLF
jgi:hypothetical protein